MLVVASIAVILGVSVALMRRRAYDRRSNECASIAILSAMNERYSRSNAAASERAGLASDAEEWLRRAKVYAARVVAYGKLRDKYAGAARYPWLPVEPDPPRPE